MYQNGRGGQLVRARAITTPTETGRTHNTIKYEVELVADSPYWQDSELQEVKIGDLQGLFSFPLRFPFKMGRYTSSSTIYNPQDEEIKPIFEVYSVLGKLVIENTMTGGEMTVNHNITAEQKMIIDVGEGTVSLYQNGNFVQDISNWLEGDFITLAPGKNIIKVANDVPDDLPACKLLYRIPVWGCSMKIELYQRTETGFERIATTHKASDIDYCETLSAEGEFNLLMPLEARYTELFQKDIIMRIDGSFWGVITYTKRTADESGTMLEVSGVDLKTHIMKKTVRTAYQLYNHRRHSGI